MQAAAPHRPRSYTRRAPARRLDSRPRPPRMACLRARRSHDRPLARATCHALSTVTAIRLPLPSHAVAVDAPPAPPRARAVFGKRRECAGDAVVGLVVHTTHGERAACTAGHHGQRPNAPPPSPGGPPSGDPACRKPSEERNRGIIEMDCTPRREENTKDRRQSGTKTKHPPFALSATDTKTRDAMGGE